MSVIQEIVLRELVAEFAANERKLKIDLDETNLTNDHLRETLRSMVLERSFLREHMAIQADLISAQEDKILALECANGLLRTLRAHDVILQEEANGR